MTQALPATLPLDASAEFKVGVSSVPYLADHGFQDMVVLPGSFYINMALRLDRDRGERAASVVRNVRFHNLIILSTEETVIKIEARNLGNSRVEYTFYEAGTENGRAKLPGQQYAARLEIDSAPAPLRRAADTDPFSIEAFQARSRLVIDSGRFYEQLRANRNQYGPAFQRITSIWRAGDQCLGRLSVPSPDGNVDAVHPSVLDAMTQVLAPFVMERGKTFILRSIDEVELADAEFPETLWGHGVLVSDGRDDSGLVGNVRVFDQSGRLYVSLSGVSFAVLDCIDIEPPRSAGAMPLDDAADDPMAATLAIAANFTADPIEDALRFWGDHFGVPIRLDFAPYNQVFQQLLDTASVFRKNRDGVNVILVAIEEWALGNRHEISLLTKERANQCFGERLRYVLPNGLEIAHLNQYETDYLYKEIFEDQCYLRRGIRLPAAATVVDIGANIGLFSLFVMSRCANPTIYAFEPAPVVFELLKANCEAYGSKAQAVNAGVSAKPGSASFTFYDKSSVFSGFHADEAEDREAIQAVVRNTLNREAWVQGDAVEGYVAELTADRLHSRICECPLTSVSAIIRQYGIDKIDLLKIDAEKSEVDIIDGIDDHDWPKIDQIVMEIHDRTEEAVKQIADRLTEKGFRCAVEHERLLEQSGLFNLYATREGADEETSSPTRDVTAVDGQTIQEFCATLRSFMNQATAPLMLCVCPRTPAAEADTELKAALDDLEAVLLSEAGPIANVHAIGSAALLRHYPVRDSYDPYAHQVGHVPYTPECYAAIGTALFRAIYALKRPPFKVIVMDCDNTLWNGACGEDGPLGVELSAPYRRLQEFMLGQMNAGMPLCLCSKNNEQDVFDVFGQRSDMVLKREHLAAWRINWNSKSENIKSLARELNLGLDSFIFIDDNPVECADVRINCRGVLTLQLPRDGASLQAFLNHVWAFDRAGATYEDRNRTRMYQENTERQKFRERTLSLKQFVSGLQLRIEIVPATDDQLGRVSQLTFRTNQFNFSTIRRSESEIRAFVKRDGATCLVVHVVDRFGDYGLVGVVMSESDADRLKVDTLLLSCRVLGKGVEHAVLAHLGQRAVSEKKRFVEIAYRATAKNAPVREFIRSIRAHGASEMGASWTFASDRLASLEYDPDEAAQPKPSAPDSEPDAPPRRERGWVFDTDDRSDPLQWIGERLYDVDRVTAAIEAWRLKQYPVGARKDIVPPQSAGTMPPVDVVPGGTLQAALLDIWRRVLGRPGIGINDNFFDVGGTSLKAVQVVATIKRQLNKTLSIVSLFECPTVTLLAAKLDAVSGDGGTASQEATVRGQRRRNVIRRKAS